MEAILKPPGNFNLTPHKVSICILLQIYAPPAQVTLPFPFPFSSVAQHNRLGMFLLAFTKSSDDIFEPKMEELIAQLRDIGVELDHWLSDNLTCRLSSLSSPDDLFNFFNELRGIVTGPDSGVVGDDQIILDSSSYLGVFVRRCILAFNLLSFEGVCHLLTNIGTYCKEALSSCAAYKLPHLNNSRNDVKALEYENMDLENFVFDKVIEGTKSRKMANEKVPFHIHSPKTLSGLIEDIEVSAELKFKHKDKAGEASLFVHKTRDTLKCIDPNGGIFLRTNWQIQGYLCEQADAIEKQNNSFPFNSFESILRQLQKFAPELHRVHFLRYLNNLYHNDYPASLENLHCYFDYSAGEEGFDSIQRALSANNSFGRFEIALLCLGIMHFHFGHPKLSLEVLTEAVRISQQQHNDTCLAYTLAAICNLLSAVGISSTTGILGSSYRPVTTIGTSLSIQQLLFVLLKRSLKRADSLKLKRLLASNRLAMAKFDLTHVQRPLLSFGPKASMKLKTCPVNVCKELRLSSQLITEFSTESSIMITDGAFSTAWLKDLSVGSLVFSLGNASGVNSNAFHYCAQPSSVPGSVLQLLGSSYLLRATAWELYGSAPLARINLLVHATCFANASSSADVALAYTKLIQQLAVFRGYKEAFAALRLVEEKFLSISKSQILLLKLQLLHERALHLGHLKRAQKLCDELGVLASSVSGVAMELKTEASLRHARTLLAANQFSQAAAVARSLFCMCYKFNLQVENATVLLLLAEIHKKSGNAVLGLPYALASLSFCQLLNLDLLKASATLTLAELWLSLGPNHAERASILIQQALPMILGHGGLELRARAYIAEAKCYISNPSFSVFENSEVVLDPLKQAAEDLEVLEYHELAAEAFYLMAMVFNQLGQPEEREEAAASFMKHINILENPNEAEDPLVSIS